MDFKQTALLRLSYLQVLLRILIFSLIWVFDKEPMITAFLQLHDNVEEAWGTASGAFR